MKSLGIYVHVPFCVKKCNYCDFQSVANEKDEDHKNYFQGLQSEILLWKELYGNQFYVDSIFIGGGTPSLVREGYILALMESLNENFRLDDDTEITIECNPNTLTTEKLIGYRQAGINRLSIGAQSLDDGILEFMGRPHSAEEFLETFRLARQSGFENINVDLMFGVPGMTAESWSDTLQRIMDMDPEHISFYSLQLEEGTPFFKSFEEGNFKEIPDDLDREMYWKAVEMLKKKYVHYEISNAAKPGFFCRHNLKYWSMADYLGIGLGAHSFVNGWRFSNLALQAHENTEEESMQEFVFTGMRKIEGIDIGKFKELFGISIFSVYEKEISALQRDGFIELHKEGSGGGMMKFTSFGIDVSNKVLSMFV